MIAAARSIMIPTFLLLVTTLLCQYPAAVAEAVRDLSEKDETLDTLYQRFYSAFMQNNQPSPPPTFEAIAAGSGNAQHSISPDDFRIGYAVEGTFFAPNKGRVTFYFWNDAENEVVFVVDARYLWPNADHNVLVLNTFTGGVWGTEDRPAGFDFTPGILVKVRIEALQNYWRIVCNGKEISRFQYRPNVPADSVNRIQLSFEDYDDANPKADLKSLSIHYDTGCI